MYIIHKASSKLAEYEFASMYSNNDWEGVDFIAIHKD